MTKVIEQVQSANEAICQNIQLLSNQRALLSQNILSQLRNLVEGVIVLLHKGSIDADFNYSDVAPGLAFISSNGKLNFLGKFHKLIQKSASHYTMDGDTSERLMLKYYEYLYRIRTLLQNNCRISVLDNLEDFPVDLDPSLIEYHEKIASKIEAIRSYTPESASEGRYYIHKIRPFFLNGCVFYEATLYRAINNVSKFDRIIAFTDIDMTDKYAAMLMLQVDSIEVLEQKMPITIIRKWEVSIRPCEFKNFARLLNMDVNVRTNSSEYCDLMNWLTLEGSSLIDLLDASDNKYLKIREISTVHMTELQLFPIIDEARRIVRSGTSGHNIIRYLMLRMRNQILKLQYYSDGCHLLSNLKLRYGCIPFDQMPFCTSLPGHNPRYRDLVECIDMTGRSHEILAQYVKNKVENDGILYTPVTDLKELGDIEVLISVYNNKLYHKHQERQLVLDKGHVFIRGYESDTVSIVEKLQRHASFQIAGYSQAVERWLGDYYPSIDDPVKVEAIKLLFSQSRVALIYGAAGTGKSTMVDHIAHYFNDKDKLFLAHTNPAIDNLKRKVSAQNSEFRTINSQVYKSAADHNYDLLVIDECSTVSNTDFIGILEKTNFKLIVLVGDVYQIESIRFGNWFGIVRSFIPSTAIFELTTPFRTKNDSLLTFWNKVRSIEEDLVEVMARHGYSRVLDKTLFESRGQDEIILCLNYDGLYGINNINRFLQSSNPSTAVTWRVSTYKVGDPVLFFDTERFRPVIYNNLKGRIIGIDYGLSQIQFDIELDRPLTEFDVSNLDELEWLEGSTVRFIVYEHGSSDDDDDSLNTIVPFQVAYAVSIHKAQGLEYDSVKIVITDANEEDITHSIFYTAVTRAREELKIFWTPETQHSVLKRLRRSSSSKDVALLSARRGLMAVRG